MATSTDALQLAHRAMPTEKRIDSDAETPSA
jgi:hypothetical protein